MSRIEATSGFVLTRQWMEKGQGQSLLFWLSSDKGPVLIEITQAQSVCFIDVDDAPSVQATIDNMPGCRITPVQLKSFGQRPVMACYFPSQKLLNQFRHRVPDTLVLYEADIRPTDRFLMERYLQAEVTFSGALESRNGYLYCRDPSLRPVHYKPQLRVASLDIETSYTENILYSIAVSIESSAPGLSSEKLDHEKLDHEKLPHEKSSHKDSNDTNKVFMVGSARSSDLEPSYLEFCIDERDLILKFLVWFSEQDPDVVVGWSVVAFDLDFLQRRCEFYKIPFSLGRDNQQVSWRTANQSSDKKFALVPGRVVLDGIELLRTATYQFESFSLENVSRELLGRGKLIHDVDARGAEIQDLFATNKAQLAAYNLEDCRLVLDIFAHTNLLEFALERSRLTGLDIDRAGGSVAAFDFLYLPRVHRHGYVAPVVADDAIGGAPGGFVLESKPGIYSDVIVLDFKSLYPSIIRTFHVDPLALVEGERSDNPIPGYKGANFSREQVILPSIIESLWAARDEAKKRNRGAMSQAIKIIMNSFYGVLGTPGCRFFDSKLVSSITLRGHEILQKTRDLIEEKGFNVIYGDTDSVFVLVGSKHDGAVAAVGQELTDYLNFWWRQHLLDTYAIDSCLEVEFETHFSKFLMPRVRGSDKGSKKRYAGVVQGADGEQLVFKGLENVRSDWSPISRKFQKELYRKIFNHEPYESYIKSVVSSVKTADFRELVIRKRLRRQLSDYQKNVPPHVKAARLADTIRAQRGLPLIYERGGWIEYVMTTSGAEPLAYLQNPIDIEFYITRQLAPVADAILCFEGNSLANIIDKQLALF